MLKYYVIGLVLKYYVIGLKHTTYLTGREQRVVVDSSNSDWLPVLSGVPQGSILWPMLFLCYINDMPSFTQNSTTALFADDSKCFRPIHSVYDCLLLRKDTDSLYNWGQNVGSILPFTTHPSVKSLLLPEKEMLLSLIIVRMTLFCVELIQLRIWTLASHLVLFGMIRRVVNNCNKNGYDKTCNRVQCSWKGF